MAGERRLEILVIDRDDTHNIEAKALLTAAGHLVQALSDPEQIADAVARQRFDLVFLDVSGIGAAAAMRAIRSASDAPPPVVAMTGLPTLQMDEAGEMAFDGFIQKPIDADEVFGVLRELFSAVLPSGDPQSVDRSEPWALRVKSRVRQKLPVAMSAYHWARRLPQRTMLRLRSRESIFTQRYRNGGWTSEESLSGAGSDARQTRAVRAALPELVAEVGAKSFLDIPCGDFNWMKDVALGVERYIGADIVADIVAENQRRYAGPSREFVKLDLIKDELPAVDVVFCRDCLVHLRERDVLAAIRNIAASGSSYLLTTTFVDLDENVDILAGEWRRLNLRRPPYGFPEPVALIDEQCTEGGGVYADKSLGLWRIADLPV